MPPAPPPVVPVPPPLPPSLLCHYTPVDDCVHRAPRCVYSHAIAADPADPDSAPGLLARDYYGMVGEYAEQADGAIVHYGTPSPWVASAATR